MKMSFASRRFSQHTSTGFTLVEMLVVIGIIVLLIGLLLPMLSRSYRNAERAKVALDIQTLSSALEAYRQDLNQYPTVVNAGDGARILCQALLGPSKDDDRNPSSTDPQPKYGFRIRDEVGGVAQSKLYGPYIQPDKIRAGDPANPSLPNPNLTSVVFIDRYRHPILYFAANPAKPVVRNPNSYVWASKASYYDERDGLTGNAKTGFTDARATRLMLGDDNTNGFIETSETAINLPFLLWSCGPDENYGPDDFTSADAVKNRYKCDDVTNFRD